MLSESGQASVDRKLCKSKENPVRNLINKHLVMKGGEK